MSLREAFEAIVAYGAAPEAALRVAAMRVAFEACTGVFTPEEPWFEARSRAFWDDAATRQGFAGDAAPHLSPHLRALARAFTRAHRGLFTVTRPRGREGAQKDPRPLLQDLWSGAAFLVDEIDDGMRDALDAASAPFDARVVGVYSDGDSPGAPTIALLPGAIFHPEEASASITALLTTAREQGMATHEVLDALLRMELHLQTLARVKAAYAYRVEALRPPKALTPLR